MYNAKSPESVEKYSAAVSISDMEVFIFPQIMYALFLANVMSPIIWEWKDDPWFKDLDKLSPYRKILRLKQFIMDKYTFNLDLDTWGLTTKEKELARFKDYIDPEILGKSNALFGYEGDKYYFDIDIRRHFGLDKYNTEIIPYWKTETVEAMTAFKYKEGYTTGAGECVSLAALYAAALFIIAEVPLEKIYMLATPLHSQNFIDIKDGLITNNRRLVTKNMWFNGTELSAKARRALQNERVTMVVNNTGYVHTMYQDATMPEEVYEDFAKKLKNYLTTDVSYEIIANFIRDNKSIQGCFQLVYEINGKKRYIEAERVYKYEHNSRFRIGDNTQLKLLAEIEEDEFYPEPLHDRIILNDLERVFKENKLTIKECIKDKDKIKELMPKCQDPDKILDDLIHFCRIDPDLPKERNWIKTDPIELSPSMSRDEIIMELQRLREVNETVDLAFTAYRNLNCAPWKPFLKAALERNPVSIAETRDMKLPEIAAALESMENESIYSGARLAQPDEVWNFRRGDGLEKALTLLNIIRDRFGNLAEMQRRDEEIIVLYEGMEYKFRTAKDVNLPVQDDFNF